MRAVWSKVSKPFWKDFAYTMSNILENLGQHKSLIQSERYSVQNFGPRPDGSHGTINLQGVADKVWKYESDRASIRRRFQESETERKEKQRDEVFKWISASEMTDIEHDRFKKRREGRASSGRWLLSQDKVENWLYADDTPPSHSLLWIHGKKGAGKANSSTTSYRKLHR